MTATQPSHLIFPVSHDPLCVASGNFQNLMFVPFKNHFLYNGVTRFGEEIIKTLADGDCNSKNDNNKNGSQPTISPKTIKPIR
jgi:hypothetical protein